LLTSLDILIARNIRNNRTIHSSTPNESEGWTGSPSE
jgi:hypothetical protein